MLPIKTDGEHVCLVGHTRKVGTYVRLMERARYDVLECVVCGRVWSVIRNRPPKTGDLAIHDLITWRPEVIHND